MAASGLALPGAGDVGRRAVHRLEQRRAGAVGVEVGRRRQPDAAGDGAGQVGEDVAEQVVGDDHVVAARASRPGRCRRRRRGCSAVVTSGYSAATSSNVRCQRSPAKVRTLVLCTSVRWRRGRPRPGRRRSARSARRPCGCSPSPGWRPRGACPCGGSRPRRRRRPRCSPARRRSRAVGGDERAQVDVEVELEAQAQEQAPLEDAGRDVRACPRRRAGWRRGPRSSSRTASGRTSPVRR